MDIHVCIQCIIHTHVQYTFPCCDAYSTCYCNHEDNEITGLSSAKHVATHTLLAHQAN